MSCFAGITFTASLHLTDSPARECDMTVVARSANSLCFALLFCASIAAAQTPATKGSLRGRVEDENGVPLADAQVRLEPPEGRAQLATTDSAGRFQLAISAPGTYRISVNRPGFFRLDRHALELVAGDNELSLVLHHETEVHTEVEVTSSAHAIDTQDASHRETLVAREILDLPVRSTHDLLQSLSAMPGVVRDTAAASHIAGARTGETMILLDGFEIGDPATGALTSRVNVDSVRGVEVASARYGAEYAHAGAGVLGLDTAVGDDHWRFGATNFIPGVNLEQGVHFGNWYPRVTLSGPLIKGRAWFSESASLQHTFQLIRGLPPGQNTTTQWLGDNLLRVQFNRSPRHILQGSFLYNQSSQDNLGLTLFSPLSTTTDRTAHRYFFSLKDQFWRGKTLWEIGLAGDLGPSHSAPQAVGTYVVTPSGTSGSFFQDTQQQARRWQLVGGAASPSREWHGAHDLSAGFNLASVSFNQVALRSAIDTLRQDGTRYDRTTFSGPAAFHLSDTQLGAFAQDAWQIAPRLRVQLGVRTDWDRLFQHALLEPRLSASFLPLGSDRLKLSAGWGLQYQPPDLTSLGQARDQQRIDTFFDSAGLTPVAGPLVTRFALPATGLRPPQFETASAEWQQRFGSRTLAGIQFINRRERDGLAYENLFSGQLGTLFLLQNNREDHYRSIEFSVRHTFGERTEIFADYIRSVARSNEVLDPTLGLLFFSAQAPGRLAWDAPNRVLSWGWTPAPFWHLFFSYFFEYRTGFPFSVVDQEQQLVGPPNRMRFPAYLNLNLGVEKRFRFHRHEWAVRLAAINLTGHSNPDSVINNVDAPGFLTFAGGQGRAFTGRLRLVGTH